MLNPVYLNKDNLLKIKEELMVNKSILLFSLLDANYLHKLQHKLETLNFKRVFKLGFYSQEEALAVKEIKILCEKVLSHLMMKKNKSITLKNVQIKKYSWKDYTLLNDKMSVKNCTEALFIFSKDSWNKEDGGNIVYVDPQGIENSVLPIGNTLLIKEKDYGEKRYIKYVNVKAKNKSFYLVECVLKKAVF